MSDPDRPGHTHRLPRAVLLTLVVICGGLVASLVLVSTLARQAQHQADVTNQRLKVLEDFIAERGEMRDEQYSTLDDRITKALCDVLNGLPAGGLLDPIRTEYGCGPGVPLAQLSPDAAQQLQQFSNGLDVPTERTPATKPRQSPPETTNAPTPTPSVAPAPVAAAPASPTTAAPAAPAPAAPSAPPLVDLTPLTDALCTGLGLCA